MAWAAAHITSVIGASYTSVSFWKTFHPSLEKNQRWVVTAFIIFSTVIFIAVQQPPSYILVTAGALNGLILPVALAIMLIAVAKKKLFEFYLHPLWMQIAGWLVVVVMGWMGGIVIKESLK